MKPSTRRSAKTVDAMVNVEPYNAIAEADGLAVKIMNYWDVDKMPVFMAATPDFISKSPDAVVAYLKAWLEVARDFHGRIGGTTCGAGSRRTGAATPSSTRRCPTNR